MARFVGGFGLFALAALVYGNGTLYGIDSGQVSGSGAINIYTIDTTTGLATATGVTITGLDRGFTLDVAAAQAVPEPSTLTLLGLGTVALAAVARRKMRMRAA